MINYLTETDLINGIKITPDSLILGDCLEVMKHIPNASMFENRCKNDMTQSEWDILKSNIKEYFI